ncbi:glycosyltransferase [Mucilaginibacter sp. L196]|uniref:glycosyltransferase n=1 Tax=Mucilaginibacter sp. L196 TaxID=1641870 RepID=UPI00131C9EAD|nr:glycosyltransferase [Mucilaginibacter sp. L196]
MVTIYTLCTKKFKYGAFALINSIRQLGIDNPIIVATDINLPELNDVEGITQVIIETDWNPVNLKPLFLLQYPSEKFIFFDADIIVTNAQFIPEIERLLATNKFISCIEGIVSEHEYRRSFWTEIYSVDNDSANHKWYYNSGFFAGNMAHHKQLLNHWMELSSQHLDLTASLFNNSRLPMPDQDILNAILQANPPEDIISIQLSDWYSVVVPQHPFYSIGSFKPYAFLHCTGQNKPWDISLTPPKSPNAYDDLWYAYLFKNNAPVKSTFKLTYMQRQWFERSLLSRIVIKLKNIIG